jgi:hypothetical protein
MQAIDLSADANPGCKEWPIFGQSENTGAEAFARADKNLADYNKTPTESRAYLAGSAGK